MASKNISQKNTPEELNLLNEWVTRLGLKDWHIILETNVKPEGMALQDADGCINYTEITKAAQIQIIDPTLRKDGIRPFDLEETLVHELLHMKLCLLERGEDWDNKLQLRLLHVIIDDLARAFVDAKRSKNE